MDIKHLIAKVACLLVGNGDSIRSWSDPWILDLPDLTPTPKVDANLDIALVVSQLISLDQSNQDISKLRLLFEKHVIDLIQKILIPNYPIEDSWSWTATNLEFFLLSQLISFVGKALLPRTLTPLGFKYGKPKFMSASKCIYEELLSMFCLLKR